MAKRNHIKVQKIAVAKARPFDAEQWVAPLTPMEILILVAGGATLRFWPKFERMQEAVRQGHSKNHTTYFIPGPTLLEALLRRHPQPATR